MNKEIRKVINASGKMSILGTSTVSDSVASAMVKGAQSFFIMEEYLLQVEQSIATIMGFESTKICASAAAGIVSAVSGVIGKDDITYALNPRTHKTQKREIILPKGHNVNFGAAIETMIEVAGGQVVEAGYANECSPQQLEYKISENTAAILYIKSHHTVQKNMLSIEEALAISKKHNLPLIVDVAAEEDLRDYNNKGIDLLIFSGSKALQGPSSGILAGNKECIQWCKNIDKGMGRAMKVSKEMASGLHQAVMEQDAQINVLDLKAYEKALPGSYITQDLAGRSIHRLAIQSSAEKAKGLIHYLESGNPAIFTRNYLQNQGIIEIDPRAITHQEMEIIIEKVKEYLND